MTDRRTTPESGRRMLRGHAIPPGRVPTDGVPAQVHAPLCDLTLAQGGGRARQLLHGAPVQVIDADGGHSFVQHLPDGYCGWVPDTALGPRASATHRVTALATHLYAAPDLKSRDVMALPMNARLHLDRTEGDFARTDQGLWVPLPHVRALGDNLGDPVALARTFLGVPYLWGGNTVWGIDCSGLVQAVLWACGLDCPADSDQQRAQLGASLPPGTTGQAGDILFWQGHVGLLSAPDRLLHATAHGMAVIEEDLGKALARIAQKAPLLAHIRPEYPPQAA